MSEFAQKPKEQFDNPAARAPQVDNQAAAPRPVPVHAADATAPPDVKGVFDHYTDAACAPNAAASGGGHEKEKQELVAKINALDLVKSKGLHGAFDQYAGKNKALDTTTLQRLLTDAGVGNGLTRGIWVKTIMEELDRCPKDGALQWQEMPFDAQVGK